MKTKLALIALLAMFVFVGCSDDEGGYTCSTCVDAPEALAANDALAKGIYKGVVVGSTGTLHVNFKNGNDNITLTLVIDGQEFLLQTESAYTDGGFEAYFYNYRGTEATDDDIRIGFGVNSDGSGAGTFGVIIPGHTDVEIELFKELSTAIVMGFEGTYSGDASGTFNMVVRQNDNGSGSLYVISRDTQGSTTSFFEGQISSDGTVMGSSGEVDIDGVIAGDNTSGTWVSLNDDSGTWRGRRTL